MPDPKFASIEVYSAEASFMIEDLLKNHRLRDGGLPFNLHLLELLHPDAIKNTIRDAIRCLKILMGYIDWYRMVYVWRLQEKRKYALESHAQPQEQILAAINTEIPIQKILSPTDVRRGNSKHISPGELVFIGLGKKQLDVGNNQYVTHWQSCRLCRKIVFATLKTRLPALNIY